VKGTNIARVRPSNNRNCSPLRAGAEEIVAQRNVGPGKAKSCRRAGICVRSSRRSGQTRHARTKTRIVKLAFPSRTHQGQHMFKLVWIMRVQPFDEDIADFKRQPEKDITGSRAPAVCARARIASISESLIAG